LDTLAAGMSLRKFLLRALLFLGLPLVCLSLGEWWLRSRLFGDDPAYASWRDPDLYTWRYPVDGHMVRSDDHAKLAVRWGQLDLRKDHPHPLLGWHGDLDSLTLLPPAFDPNDPRAPLVLLGWGWERHHLVEELIRDTSLSRQHRVIDLSVDQFALDQDLLLLEHTRTTLKDAIVFLWVDLDELDRLHRAFMDRPKPWFTQDVYTGVIQDVPLPADPQRYLDEHPADPGLYVYHLFRSRVLQDTVMSLSAMESRERRLCELAKKLLGPALHSAADDGLQVVVLLEQATMGEASDRRRWAVHDACKSNATASHHLKPRLGFSTAQVGGMIARERLLDPMAAQASPLDSLMNALDMPNELLTPMQQRLATILKDPNWLGLIREKARKEGVPLVTMMERDARYLLEQEHAD